MNRVPEKTTQNGLNKTFFCSFWSKSESKGFEKIIFYPIFILNVFLYYTQITFWQLPKPDIKKLCPSLSIGIKKVGLAIHIISISRWISTLEKISAMLYAFIYFWFPISKTHHAFLVYELLRSVNIFILIFTKMLDKMETYFR